MASDTTYQWRGNDRHGGPPAPTGDIVGERLGDGSGIRTRTILYYALAAGLCLLPGLAVRFLSDDVWAAVHASTLRAKLLDVLGADVTFWWSSRLWEGIAGTAAMALVLLYPLRKFWGQGPWQLKVSSWFQIHMVLGLFGPVLVLYHCFFELHFKSDANVALIAMLIVVMSGFVGQFMNRTTARWRMFHMPLFVIMLIATGSHIYSEVWPARASVENSGHPAVDGIAAPATDAAANDKPQAVVRAPAAPTRVRRSIRVAEGETLSGIARRYGTTIERLKQQNGLKSDKITALQVLELPVDGPSGDGPTNGASSAMPSRTEVAAAAAPTRPLLAPPRILVDHSDREPRIVAADQAAPVPARAADATLQPSTAVAASTVEAPKPPPPAPETAKAPSSTVVAQLQAQSGSGGIRSLDEQIAALKEKLKSGAFHHAQNETGFALVDKHTRVDCAKCHTAPLHLNSSSSPVPSSSPRPCKSCHMKDDVHHGRRPQCANCHEQTNWRDTH